MKNVFRLIGVIVIVIIVIGIIMLGRFFYSNMHWWKKELDKIKKSGAEEKVVTLPNGNIINYGETTGDRPALLLIHGQMGAWEDYSCVLPELAKNWHVYAVDVYGHGESSHEENLYYIDVNGDDLIWFINNIICEKTVVSGHSNGALTAAYIAA
ncbi:MAG: alpha/beta fold hydrolase [Lachnotalea sp.]